MMAMGDVAIPGALPPPAPDERAGDRTGAGKRPPAPRRARPPAKAAPPPPPPPTDDRRPGGVDITA
jgi:hypothetical protein